MRNYLLRLGWSHGDSEIISDAQAAEWFSLEKIGKSPSRFDFTKLKSVNKHYIKEKSDVELLDLISSFFDREISQGEKNRLIRAIKFIKERTDLLEDLAKNSQVYLNNFSAEFSSDDKKIIVEKKSLISDLSTVFNALQDWSHDGIKNSLNEFAAAKNLKIKDFGPLLRLILTFSSASAGGIFDVIEILEKDEVLKRIEFALQQV